MEIQKQGTRRGREREEQERAMGGWPSVGKKKRHRQTKSPRGVREKVYLHAEARVHHQKLGDDLVDSVIVGMGDHLGEHVLENLFFVEKRGAPHKTQASN